jgi:hypothetical protein
MALLTITPSEIKRRKIIKLGWYHIKCTDVRFEKSKDKDAYNHIFDFIGLENESKEVPLMLFVPEKYPDMGIPMIEAFLGKKLDEETGLNNFDPRNVKGAILYAHINPGKDAKGTMRNNIDEWAPARPEFKGEATTF